MTCSAKLAARLDVLGVLAIRIVTCYSGDGFMCFKTPRFCEVPSLADIRGANATQVKQRYAACLMQACPGRSDLTEVDVLGIGSFGKVLKVVDGVGNLFALKVIQRVSPLGHPSLNNNGFGKLVLEIVAQQTAYEYDLGLEVSDAWVCDKSGSKPDAASRILTGYVLMPVLLGKTIDTEINGYRYWLRRYKCEQSYLGEQGTNGYMTESLKRRLIQSLRDLNELGLMQVDFRGANAYVFGNERVRFLDFGSLFQRPQPCCVIDWAIRDRLGCQINAGGAPITSLDDLNAIDADDTLRCPSTALGC